MLYCAATETGYESLTGKSCEIFIPQVIKDEQGQEKVQMRAATSDYLSLGTAAIVAAYTRRGEDAPITADDILYNATSKEVTTLITTVIELRNAWYRIPSVVPSEDDTDKKEDEPKNS